MVTPITESSFDELVLTSPSPVVVMFYTTDAYRSKTMLNKLNAVSLEYPNIKFYSAFVGDNRELIVRYSLSKIPSILIFKDGSIRRHFNGIFPQSYIKNKIDEVL